MELNYKKLYTLDLKSIFNIESNFNDSNEYSISFLMEISKGIKLDKQNIVKKINSIKSAKGKFDFVYFLIYDVEDLKLQFTKKIKMKNRIVNYKKYIKERPDLKNNDLEIKIRFRFDLLGFNSVELGFYILDQIKKIVSEFVTFLKQCSKKIIDSIYHPTKVMFDAEFMKLLINGLVGLEIAVDQYGKNISRSKLTTILTKTFMLKNSTGKEYTPQTLIKKQSKKYNLKKNPNDLNEFIEKVQEFKNVISETTYFKGIRPSLINKIQS
jgi:hypothetical protein